MGLFIGLIVGLVVAAGMAWYFYSKPSEFKPVEQVPPPSAEVEAPPRKKPPEQVEAPPIEATPAELPQAAKPKTDYSFYDILPGSEPPKPKPPPKLKEVWWLQLFALKSADDADRYKARLTLLNLPVVVQTIESGGLTLYRVRVGPYPTEDAALGALDTLSLNNFEPRLLKETVNP